jgi:hypothetical protein
MVIQKKNIFQLDCVVNLSQTFVYGCDGTAVLNDKHGLLYVWESGSSWKLGELSEISGKTPEEAFDASYSSSRDRGQITVRRLYVFDKDTVTQKYAINKRGFDKALHSLINHYHSSGNSCVPFFIDVNREHDSNEEFFVGFDASEQHWANLDVLVYEFLDPLYKKSTPQSLKVQISPRGYQKDTIESVINTLKNEKRCLLHAFPGWGKSTMGLYAIVKLAIEQNAIKHDAPLNVVVCSPIVDTLQGFVESAVANNYFEQKINVYTTDSIMTLLRNKENIVSRINEAKGEINLFILSVQGIRFADPDDKEQLSEQVSERTIRKRYTFLTEIGLFAQIADERHTEYGGKETSKVFEDLVSEYVLDLTATPYNLLQGNVYTEKEVVCDSMLHALHQKKNGNSHYQGFPDVSIASIGPEIMVQNSVEFSKYYTTAEDWDPRKLFARKGKNFVHHKVLLDFFAKTIGDQSGMSLMKNPMTVINDTELSDVAKNTIMVVVPEGMNAGADNSTTAYENAARLVELLNSEAQFSSYHAVTSYELTMDRKIKPGKAIEKLRAEHKKKIIVVTHRKMTTGSDVPPMGSIIMLDKMSSPGEFEQLLGRIFRIYKGKDSVRCYIFCPNMSISHVVYSMAKDAASHKNHTQTTEREMFDCLPITMVGTMRSVISYDDAYRVVLEETKRLMSGDYYTSSFFDRFPSLHDAIGELEFRPLKSSSKVTEVTGKNLSKVSKVTNRQHDAFSKKEKQKRKVWKETMKVLLNEVPMIGYSTSSKNVKEVFETDLAKALFGDENCQLMITALDLCFDFSQSVNISYREMMEQINNESVPFDELNDRLFRNEKYKIDQGLVYVPTALAYTLINTLDDQLTSKQNLVIIVPNALSGILSVVLRRKYPTARIICVEYFPYYVDHLRSMGFEVIDIQGDVENVEHLNKKHKIINLVMGNPPYDNGSSARNKKLWAVFSEKFLELTEVLAFVTPNNIVSEDGINGKNLRTAIKKNNFGFVTAVNHGDKKHFKGINVDTCHWVIKKNVPDQVNPVIIKSIPKDIIITDICTKITDYPSKLVLTHANAYAKKELYAEPATDRKPLYFSGTKIMYTDMPLVQDETLKLVFSFSSSYHKMFITSKATGMLNLFLNISSKEEGESIINYCKSKLFRFVASHYKKTSGFTPFVKNGMIPKLDLTRTWTDQELYEHFGLTEEEIDYIEANVK